MQNNNSNISWKYRTVKVTAIDGSLLQGKIKYSQKDYNVCMTEPFNKQGCGGHLQYGIPAIYVTDEPRRKNIVHIDLLDVSRNILLNIYEEYKSEK